MGALILTLLLQQVGTGQGFPAELRAALTARRFLNAQFTWEAHTYTGGHEYAYWGVATYVGSDIAYETHYPDQPAGTSLVDHAILRGLYWEDRLLENNGDALSARLLEDPRMAAGIAMDYRVLGMHARTSTTREYHPFEPIGNAVPEFTVARQDGLVVVAARERVGGDVGERRWSIDPQQGWNVLRYEERANDRLVRSVSSKLARYGECWFPREVEYRNADGPYLTIRMRDVKLNDPSLPKHLTPEFIEVVPGTNVYHMFPDAPSEMVGFDGARFVDFEELRRRVRAGEVQRGEAFLRALDRLTDVGARERTAEKYTPSAWEKYVAKFIAEHQLDPAQTSRAWSIYRDCRSAANRYLLKAAAEIDQLDKRQEALKFLPDVNEAKTLAIKKAEVYRPVQEIFDEQLAPRLDKLLTRAQRALGETTATRPTSRSATRY